MNSPEHIDFLSVGHICRDISPTGLQIGGAAAYSTATANVLGCHTAVVTSSAADENWQVDLPSTALHIIPAPETTRFENIYTPDGRQQTIHAVARDISGSDVPESWQRASIVLIGPIANEVDPQAIYDFSNSLIGLAPQGWLRRWDDKGRVYTGPWPEAQEYLRLAAAVFVSEEDLLDQQMFEDYRQWARLLVMTRGQGGCSIYHENDVHHFPALPASVVDTTGAGDVFCAAFLVRLFQTGGNPLEAAKFANYIASLSIGSAGLAAKMTAISSQLAQS